MDKGPDEQARAEQSFEAQRRDERDSLLVLANLRLEGSTGESTTVRVRNVSAGGLMAQVTEVYRPGARVEVELNNIGIVAGAVAWAEAGRIGIAFDHPIDKTLARKPRSAASGTDEEMLMRPYTNPKRPSLRSR